MQNNIDKIINEEVDKLINEGVMDDLRGIFSKLMPKIKKKSKKNKEEKKKEKDREKKKKDEKPDIRKKKLVGGGTKEYNYDDYKRSNVKVNHADFQQIVDTVDQEKSDIAAIAREVFPDHTEEGAQSQLRKILNGERPLTKPVAKKLRKLIARGQIAVKAG